MGNITLPRPAENALSTLQDTELSPMEEALFQTWTKANKIPKPDAPDDHTDYRGIYKESGGAILPNGQLQKISAKVNSAKTLQEVLHQKMMDRLQEVTGKQDDEKNQIRKEERQDVTHQQKMEMERMKLQKVPHEVKMKEHDQKIKEMDVQKQELGNDAKRLDITHSLVQPTGVQSATAKTSQSPSGQK